MGLLTLLAIVVLEPCAYTKLDFCGMISIFVVSFTVVILNAALAVLSDKGQCVCVCVCGGGGGGGGGREGT